MQYNKDDELALSYRNNHQMAHVTNYWISQNPEKAKAWRGKHGESLLHWGAITSIDILQNCITLLDLPINILDKYNNTPLDWIIERYYSQYIQNRQSLNDEGRLLISEQTAKHVIYLAPKGATCRTNLINLFSKTGSFGYIDYIFNTQGNKQLLAVGKAHPEEDQEKSILHNWLLLSESPQKHQKIVEILNRYNIPVDKPDSLGRTPLYYAIEAWVLNTDISLEFFWQECVRSLLRWDADPNKESLITQNGKRLAPIDLIGEDDRGKYIAGKFAEIVKDIHRYKTDDKYREKANFKFMQLLSGDVTPVIHDMSLSITDKSLGLRLPYAKWLRNLKR